APPELAERHAGAVLDRHAGGVVAAILQATQTVHQNRRGLAFPHVSDDATHITGEQFKIEATISGRRRAARRGQPRQLRYKLVGISPRFTRTWCDASWRKRWSVSRFRQSSRARESL